MPITPLHFGVMAPVFVWSRSWLALTSFSLVNPWIDLDAITAWFSGQPLPGHARAWLTMEGALLFAAFVSVFGILPGGGSSASSMAP